MKCLIAGGAGFIGSHIADRFVQAGHEVTVIDGLLARTGGRRENLAGLLPASNSSIGRSSGCRIWQGWLRKAT